MRNPKLKKKNSKEEKKILYQKISTREERC